MIRHPTNPWNIDSWKDWSYMIRNLTNPWNIDSWKDWLDQILHNLESRDKLHREILQNLQKKLRFKKLEKSKCNFDWPLTDQGGILYSWELSFNSKDLLNILPFVDPDIRSHPDPRSHNVSSNEYSLLRFNCYTLNLLKI